MAVIGDATIDVHADTTGFGKTVNSRFAGIARSAATIFATAFAATKAFDFIGDSLKEAREAAQIARLSEAVVKSTGGAAHVSVQQLGDLAERLSNIAAIDDEVIQGAENVLLTFTKVRNEVGAGNNIFDRATEAALNMSAALKIDLQGATIQLGKALNDPIKGITALSRAGVSFTAEQKATIKSLVESGKVLEAQKIILNELGSEFGGAAAAAADPTARLSVVVGNLKERIGLALLPTIETVATWLSDKLPGALDTAGRWFTYLRQRIGDVIDFLRPTFDLIVLGVQAMVAAFQDPDVTSDGFVGVMERIGVVLATVVVPAIQESIKWLTEHQGVMIAVGIAVAAAVAPFYTLAAGLIYAYTQFEGFRDVVDSVAAFLRDTVAPAVADFARYVIDAFGDAVAWVKQYWPQISEAVGHVMVAVQTYITVILGAIKAVWSVWGDDITSLVMTYFAAIRTTIENTVRVVQGIIQTVLAIINGDWGKAWDGIKQVASAVWDQIKTVVSVAIEAVRAGLSGTLATIGALWGIAWDGLKSALSTAWDAISTAVLAGIGNLLSFYVSLPGKILDALGSLAGKLLDLGVEIMKSLAKGIVDGAKDAVQGALGWVTDQIPDWKGPLAKDKQLLVPTGKAIMAGLLAGIRTGSADVRAYLQATTQNIVSDVQSALGALRGVTGMAGARRALTSATQTRDEMQQRAAALPGLITDAVARLQEANVRAAKVTPAEALAIDRARQAEREAAAKLNELRASGTADALDLRIAEGELSEATDAVTKAQRDAVGPTEEVADLTQRLADLRAEQTDIAHGLADAEDAVRDAQMGVVDAQAQLMQSAATIAGNPALLQWFRDIATEAGLSDAAIRGMVATLAGSAGLPVHVTPGGTVVTAPDASGRQANDPRYGSDPTADVRTAVANIARFVGETWTPGKIDRLVEQIEKGQTTLDKIVQDVDRRINGPQATVNFQSIDTKGLMERMNIKAAVGEAVSTATRLRPVVV